MKLSSRLGKSALATAVGALAAASFAIPAHAAVDPTANDANTASAQATVEQATTAPVVAPVTKAAPYKGLVIARTGLLVRSGPTTKAKIIGSLRYHQVVGLTCKVNGQNINGNPRWYKLSNGTWAWASARYIANIGAAPGWCKK